MNRIKKGVLLLTLTLAMAVPANAMDYTITEPDGPEYAKPDSIEVVYTPDGGARKNTDLSKNAALIPPRFGSPSADTPNTGEYLTPNLAPGGMAASGAAINGSGAPVSIPTFTMADEPIVSSAPSTIPAGSVTVAGTQPYTAPFPTCQYTEVTGNLYYSGGYLATLQIPAIDVNVKVYQGTDSNTLAKGAGHFEDTSIWQGNVAIAGHNRGVNCYFGNIHKLQLGDRITYTTKLGSRTYEVTGVSKVSETDNSGLADSADNTITLYTCVRDERDFRWCVKGVAIG